MRRLRKRFPYPAWLAAMRLVAMLAGGGFAAGVAWAQPANDNFADAEDITDINFGLFGSVSNDLSAANGEIGEPSHAGFPAVATVWYKWTATNDGVVQLDTLSSPLGSDTLLAVYTGTTLGNLRQVAANDDLFPFTQQNVTGQFLIVQPFNGPSALQFNAKVGTTYYFAVGAKFAGGPIEFGWAFHPAGVFRFATEDATTTFVFNTNTIPPTFQFVTTPVYQASEWESFATENASTFQTYYSFGVPGLLVTVTRVGGSSGRMLVDYSTEDMAVTDTLATDIPALDGIDYFGVQGTLVFDDFEMTKRIMIPIQPDFFLPQFNRDFAVVLSNPRPDTAESPDVSPPRIDGAYGRAIVRILDADIDPVLVRNFQENTNSPTGFDFQPTNAVFNMARAAYRTVEDVNGYWSEVDLWIDRTGTNRDSITLHYRINNFLGANDNSDPAEQDNNVFPLQPGSDYATPLPVDNAGGGNAIGIHGTNADFELEGVPRNNYNFPGGGTITFPGGNRFNESRALTFRVFNDTLTEFNEDFHISLYANRHDIDGDLVGMIGEANITILFDDQDPPAGSVDQFHNADFGAHMVPPVTTTPPNQAHPGADNVVRGMVVQPDNKTVIVGAFQSFNATIRNRIARMNVNGSLDTSFNPGSGANDVINAIVQTAAGQFIIGGGFSSYNGTTRARVARINAGGTLDASFNPIAPNGSVRAVAVQPDGKVIIAGDFTSVGGTPRLHIARLNSNGSLDATFDPGAGGPDGTIRAVALQTDGKVIIGGEFNLIGGTTFGGIARLNDNGTLDGSFNPGAGTDGIVYALGLQTDDKVLVGGEFSSLDFNPRRNLTRLNTDGSLDLTFDPASSGADGTVYSIVQGGNGLYVGGSFLSYNGTHRRGLVRLFADGTVDTGFLDPAYNQFAGLHRARFSDPPGIVYSVGLQTDGKVMIGGSFQQVGGGQASLEVRPDAADFNVWSEPKARDGVRNRSNVARLLAGSTPGPGNISLTAESHTANENQAQLSVSLTRANGTLGYLFANFEVEDGLAQSGTDYIYNAIPPIYLSSWELTLLGFQPSEPNSTTRMHSDGLFGDNFVPTDIYGHNWFSYTPGNLIVTILNDSISQGNRNTTFRLSNPTGADVFYLGGENIPLGGALGLSQAPLTILDDDNSPGVLGFASANFVVNENVTNAVVTVVRTNGSYGTISCNYATISGGTATPGVGQDYLSRSGPLTFGDGETNKTFTIPINNDSGVEPDETILLRLTASSGVTLGLSNAIVTIIDNDTPGGKLNFSSANFSTNENAGAASVTVTRSGSSAGTVTVFVGATNGTATSGVDFTAVTNQLTWPNGDVTPKTIVVPLLDDVAVEPDETVNLRLFSPTLNSSPNPASLGVTSTATLTIINDDLPGKVSFSTASYNANENGGPAIITVVRTGGSAESVSVNFAAFGGTAVDGFDFSSTNGTLSFGPGELSKSFTVPIIDNPFTDVPRFVTMSLSNAAPSGALGAPSFATLNIVDDESVNEPPGGPDTVFVPTGMNDAVFALALQADGSLLAGGDFTQVNLVPRLRIVRMNSIDGSVDGTFQASANGSVLGIVPQADGRVVVCGAFTTVDSVVRNHIGRVNSNGSLDSSFDPGSGTDNPVFAVTETFVGGQRKLFIGGGFTVFNGTPRHGIARLNSDGSLDTDFNPPLGVDGIVYAVAAYPTNTTHAGKVLIGGDFTEVNGVSRSRIARLNSDGSLDVTFDPGTGANDAVRALAIQADGRVLAGGSFTNFNGTAMNRFTRLNANGSLDSTFTPGVGADDTVSAIVVQGDTRIVLAGQFTHCSGVSRNRLTRLYNDGTVDPTINFGSGANNFVAAAVVQPDGKIVIGGGFTAYDDVPRQRIARIYGGSVAGSGTLEFTSATYRVDENGTNATIVVRRRGGTSGAPDPGSITVDVETTGGTATNGVHYLGLPVTVNFPSGEVFQTVNLPLIDDFEINSDRTVELALSNITPPGSAALGNQPIATLTIVNDDSAVSFSTPTYTANENIAGGVAIIQIVRAGSTHGSFSVDFTTLTNGTATPGVDFTAVTNTLVFADGEALKTVSIPILDDLLIEGNETVSMELTNANGALLLSPSQATLTIVENDLGPGQIAFALAGYTASENGGNAVINLVRTNGHSGSVSVNYFTSDGSAVAPVDYTASVGAVTFGNGETNKSILVPIADDSIVEANESFNVTLTNAGGGATIIGPTNVAVTILDNEVGLTFSSPVYVVGESGVNAVLTVLRINGSNGVVVAQFSTGLGTNNTATAGLDYTGITNGILTFNTGETIKTFTIAIIDDTVVEGDETFNVSLSTTNSGIQILTGSTVVGILDNDTGVGFAPSSYTIDESGTNVLLTVVRTNVSTGDITVAFSSTNGTATAGDDYAAAGGVLVFTNGEAVKTISVPITDDTQVEGDENFQVVLSSPGGGAQLIGASTAVVTITDNDAGIKFSSPAYVTTENGVQATITVLRTSVTNSTVAVNYSTSNGTATNGQDYFAASGTLVFTNGEMSRTFTVGLIDDTLEEGSETVLLSLSSPTGQVSLLSPSAAILTILDNDGSLILPAGSLMVTENGAANGAIDLGETVRILFAMRNASGADVTNLVATLLATNGVTAPSVIGSPNYGNLPDGGASVSRQFQFTANGTNGSIVSATFQLQADGPLTNYNRVTFNFLIGSATTTVSNLTGIAIVDNNKASPYPSTIEVSGLIGIVSKVTLTLTNLSHGSPDDIDMLLTGPSGANAILMSDVGGVTNISNVTLTFDDAAAVSLPNSATITNGTYKPTNFLTDNFPSPAPPSPWGSTLSTFGGSNPNGVWSLFIVDDLSVFAGSIGPWSMAITTSGPIPSATDLSLKMIGPVAGIAGSNMTYTVVVTNHGPWAASGIKVTNTPPAGAVFVSATPSGAVTTNAAGEIIWTVGSLAKDATTNATIVVRPSAVGLAVSTSSVLGAESDPNLGNNVAIATTTVNAPTADLAVGVVDAPDPVFIGTNNNLTYTIVVTNFGPATATGVTVTNTLPPAVTFVSASPAGYTRVGAVVTFTNLGSLNSNAQILATIIVRPTVVGALTNTAAGGSAVTDPFKGNNTVSVKTLVETPQLTLAISGNNLVISWPADAGGYALERTTSLSPPVTWTPVTTPPPSAVGNQMVVTIPLGSGNEFFRLRTLAP